MATTPLGGSFGGGVSERILDLDVMIGGFNSVIFVELKPTLPVGFNWF